MKKLLIIKILACVCMSMAACAAIPSQIAAPAWKITLKVADQNGMPVENAEVTVAWWSTDGSSGQDRIKGSSSRDGEYSAQGRSGKLLTLVVRKDGYYIWRMNNYEFETTRLNRWMPWNPTVEVELKEIRNPIPMYARDVRTYRPKADGPVGFDLERADWVSPYGAGKVSDLIINIEGERGDGLFDSTLTLTFSNEGDGLVPFTHPGEGSLFLSGHEAPEDGYQESRKWRYVRDGPHGENLRDYDKSNHFYFRVRTKLDALGEVQSALYGKIYYDFRHGPRTGEHGGHLRFMYYMNPDGTRNMEFDPNQNLLPPPPREFAGRPPGP